MNKKLYFLIGGVVLLALIGFLVMRSRGGSGEEQVTGNALPQAEKLAPVESSVKVAVKQSVDGKKATLTVTDIPDKYTDIDYEFTYDTKDGVPRGVLGVLPIDNGQAEKEVVLGSCSTNVCTYDEGVTKVKVTLKFNSDSGARLFEKEFTL